MRAVSGGFFRLFILLTASKFDHYLSLYGLESKSNIVRSFMIGLIAFFHPTRIMTIIYTIVLFLHKLRKLLTSF